MSHDAGAVCGCVTEHRPVPAELNQHHILPLAWGGADVTSNRVWICPTTHVNVHELLRAYAAVDGLPTWSVRSRFSAFTRALAAEGWRRFEDGMAPA